MKTAPRRVLTFLSRILLFILLITALILALNTILLHFQVRNNAPAYAQTDMKQPVVVLDPGHGGMDSGAVSVFGEEEKNLNLRVANALGAFLEEAGVKVVFTRREDEMLTWPGASSSKVGDLMGRVSLAKEYPNALFVSIHMNTLPQEKYSGLQVFYSENNSRSKALAQTIQDFDRNLLQPENHREIKKGGSAIFILDRLNCPAVLVECGFLSNREEAALLADEGYQNKLAYVLSRGILRHMTENEKNEKFEISS